MVDDVWEDLAAGVHRQTTLAVDPLVPHAQPALFRFAEVVRTEDTRGPIVEINRDQALVGIAISGQVGGHDDGKEWLKILVRWEV